MRRDPPDTNFFDDVRAVNREFLGLIRHPQATEHCWASLGLEPGLAAAIRALSAEELEFTAGVPGLLAGFAALPIPSAVADLPRPELPPDWLDAAEVFAAALMTFLWQVSRRDPLAGALCMGPGERRRRELEAIRFGDIPGRALLAVRQLRARYGRHPRLWPELLRAARGRDRQLRELCRLDLISMGLLTDSPADDWIRRKTRAG